MPLPGLFRRSSAAAALITLSTLVALPAIAGTVEDTPPRVLFLSKSSGYEHGVIKRKDGQPSHVETVLEQLAENNGFDLEVSKDASLINAANLANYDVVIFFTTGNLFEPGGEKPGIFSGDGESAMKKDGLADLMTWIEAGGGFMGFHCATDTFKSSDLGLDSDVVTDYVELIGGEFRTHGQQFVGTVKLIDDQHPAAASIPAGGWQMNDEWYLFQKENADRHVLAELDPGPARTAQAKVYDVPDYPVIWTRSVGEGRVYYNAMGHREDVWTNEVFQKVVVDAILWSAGDD